MGELLVWVNGVGNSVNGVEGSTTAREIVIAVAQSYRLVGCFNLIEKTPKGERCLRPNEYPWELSKTWGQNSPNCFILRKKVVSPEGSRPSSSSSSQFSPVRTKAVEGSSTSGISSGVPLESSSKSEEHKPSIVKPKVKPKPKTKPKPKIASGTSKQAEVKPTPVPRKRTSSSTTPSGVQDEVIQPSEQHRLYNQPDILVKSPHHNPPSIQNLNSKPKERQNHVVPSKSQNEETVPSTDGNVPKQAKERLTSLEIQRQQQEKVEKALKEKRDRENEINIQSGTDKTRKQPNGENSTNKPNHQKRDLSLTTSEREKQVDDGVKEGTPQLVKTPVKERHKKDVEEQSKLEETKRSHNEKDAGLEQKKNNELDRQKEKKKTKGKEEKRKKEINDQKRKQETDRLKQLEEQKEKERQKQKEEDEKRRKIEEEKRRQEEEERKKQIEKEEKQKLADLVKAQECKLNHQKSQLTGLDTAIQALLKFENDPAIDKIQEEISNIEQSIQRNQALLNEKDFWDNELDLERQMHKKLEASLSALKEKIADCNRQISQKQEEIERLSKTIKKEEKKVTLGREQAEEVKAVKEELKELEHEYEVITANLTKVNEKLTVLDEDFQEKQKELKLVEEDYGKIKTKELHIIPDDKTEGIEFKEIRCVSPTLHRVLKGSPRQLALATPSTDNPEGVFL